MRIRLSIAAALLCISVGGVHAGHDGEYDPALKRYPGMITALGAPDAAGYAVDELRGWRLTILAGKLLSKVFEVQANGASTITVSAREGPLNGVAVKDVFVVEEIAVVQP